jgi:hypothetical protein
VSSTTRPHSTLVLHTAGRDAVAAGIDVRALPGIAGVTADPGRRQLVVRFDASRVDEQRIRLAVRPRVEVPQDAWLELLPKVGRAVPVVAALLA